MRQRQSLTVEIAPDITEIGTAVFQSDDLFEPLVESAARASSDELTPIVPSVYVQEIPELQPLTLDGLALKDETVEQTAAGAVAALLSAFSALSNFKDKVFGIYQTFEEIYQMIDQLFFNAQSPDQSVAEEGPELLQAVEGMLEIVAEEVSEIIDAIDGLSEKLDTDTVHDQMVAAMTVLNQINSPGEPTSEQRDALLKDADELMNDVIIKIPPMLNDAPMEMLSGLIAPTLMAATQAYIAAILHASDQGLGQSVVKANIVSVYAIMSEIYAEDGVLAKALSGGLSGNDYESDKQADGFTYELYSAYEPETDGQGFVWVETITGPNGTFEQRVVADDSFVAGSALNPDLLDTYVHSGSMHGVHADGINLSGKSPFAGLTIDAVIPFDTDVEVMHYAAHSALEAMRHQANTQVLLGELDALGKWGADVFLKNLPSTAGLTVAAGDGNDTINSIEAAGELSPHAEVSDLIDGGAGDDTIETNGGADALFGGSGFDILDGGSGNDKLFGGLHDDELFGGDGRDLLQGDGGRDYLDGGSGNDILYQAMRGDSIDISNPSAFAPGAEDGGTIYGGAGNDVLVGDNGGDALFGGLGLDRIFGFDGVDEIQGGEGNDEIDGGADADVIDGGAGNDIIEGGSGNDAIDGGMGDDVIIGGSGNDTIDGGFGVDTIIFRGKFHGSVNEGGVVPEGLGYSDQGVGPASISDYSVVKLSSGDWVVTDLRADGIDGVDLIRGAMNNSWGDGVEFLKFDNALVELDPVVVDQGYAVEPEPQIYTPVFGQDYDDLTYDVEEPWF